MLKDELSPTGRGLVEAAERIATNVSAVHAETWDRENRFPTELFQALHAERLDSMTVPTANGGWGIGPDTDDPLPVWLVTRALASGDSSSSHCQQVHTNMVHSVALLGTADQQKRFLTAVVEDGAVFGGWGSEQDGRPPAGGRAAFTVAKKVPGGYQITGKKYYSTNAGTAKYAVVFAYPDDVPDPLSHLLLCLVDCEKQGVRVNPSWWDSATGMRATVSHEVDFEGVFVSDDDILGPPGAYWRQQVQARYLPQFSSNFQGAGLHMLNAGMDYLRERNRQQSEVVQRYMGEAHVLLTAAESLLGSVAGLYRERRYPEAFDASRILRAFSQMAVDRVFTLVQNSCGSSFCLRPHPTERLLRDWQFYSRHENLDLILGATGKSQFGLGGEGSPEAFGFSRDLGAARAK